MYAKHVTVKYFKGTGEYFCVVDGVATLYPTLKEALKEASSEFAREVIRHERTIAVDDVTG